MPRSSGGGTSSRSGSPRLDAFSDSTPGGIEWSTARTDATPTPSLLRLLRQDLRNARGLVALVIWLWISNVAILFGHELDAELERSAEIEEGRPGAKREIQLEPRADP